ncbi:extracellular solute-binding protein [Oceanispirochaeta crateris]|uniref:Extracellular solute-binding protein n=1 Tax=Oceanispirochaeta crateris TaxID=2518645 RepID=A0A5C1QSH8_9SPIO|nr:extracellular solute-binding protein [Oceanispirochaeta crateris]QEN08942.1 extracellular solute-binding protein [Oceanispirochaeta crateris]
MKKNGMILLIVLLPFLSYAKDFNFGTSELLRILGLETVKESEVSIDHHLYKGSSLLEILPLMEEVYQMEIQTASETILMNEEALGEFWAESWLIPKKAGLDLIFNGKKYDDLVQLKFKGSPMESEKLEIWLSWEGVDLLKEEIQRFARHHNIEIKSIEVPSPDSKLQAVVRARGEVPDLVMIQSSAVEKLVSSRAIQNLNYVQTSSLMDQGVEAFTLNNKLWALPFYYDTQIVFYNKSLIPAPPSANWTLNDMEQIARSIKGQGIYPLAWNAYSSNWLIPFQMSFGKEDLIDANGRISVNDIATKKALEYILNLKDKELLFPMERDAMDALFIAGKIGMIMSGSYGIPYFESLGLNFGVLPYPVNQTTRRPLSPLLDFKAFCMTRQTKHPILSRRLLQYLLSASVQQRFCPALSKLPARTDILELPDIAYGALPVLESSMDKGTIIPPLQVYSIYKNNMWKLLRFALSDQMSVQQTLEKGQLLMDNTMND